MKDWKEVVGTVVLSVATIGLGRLVVDYMKAKGHWPKPNELSASGDCGCVGEDPIIEAGKGLS